MLHTYQFWRPVKYHEIYSDLLEKIEKRNAVPETEIDADEEYTLEDVNKICLVIYQEELLETCGSENMMQIGDAVEQLWENVLKTNKTELYSEFIELVKKYQRDFFAPFDQITANFHRMYFGILFDFNLFYITHQCLRFIGEKKKIPKELLNEFANKLTNSINQRHKNEK